MSQVKDQRRPKDGFMVEVNDHGGPGWKLTKRVNSAPEDWSSFSERQLTVTVLENL